MNDVFISYRRADTNFHARQLCDLLRQHLGEDKVFMDKDGIPYGKEFLRVIADRLSNCAVFLAVMGPQWLHPRKGQRPRLFEPNDTLRLEVLIALNRPILVIPLLVAGAENMPEPSLLPASIAGLAAINGKVISDDNFADDVAVVAKMIKATLADRLPVSEKEIEREKGRALQLIESDLKNNLPGGPRFGQLDPDKTKFAEMHGSDGEAWRKISSEGLRPIPFRKPRGGTEPVLRLSEAWGSNGLDVVGNIEKAGKIVFHAVGSTGNTRSPADMITVTDRMVTDFRERDEQSRPAFLFHLGDVIYMFGEAKYYYDQFYVPYRQYPAPIFAIPGNHDGTVVPGTGVSTLAAFLENFCAEGFHVTQAARGIGRTAQIQPGVYFTLEAPFIRIISLYSNVLEGPGVISDHEGIFPELGRGQVEFLEAAFRRVSTDKFKGAVIVAAHHDLYSPRRQGGSPKLLADLDSIALRCGVWPHAFLSAHSHTYQRYTRTVKTMQIPYVVAGNGGYRVGPALPGADKAVGKRVRPRLDNVRLEAFDAQHYGFLRVIVDEQRLRIEYQPVSGDNADAVTVDLNSRKLVRNAWAK
jgi:hypothetical protein